MASSILLRNKEKLRKSISDKINYIDLDFELNGRRGVSSYYGDAITVSYVVWLKSMPGDYIRNPTKGGFFRNQLNRYTFSPTSEESIASDLKAETNALFKDIELINVEVKCLYASRTWSVKVAIMDKNTGMFGATDLKFYSTN
jgi:hypothetical protein